MLKLLACIFMLLDHIGYYFDPYFPPLFVIMLRVCGRLAFPIFAWNVARGYSRTRNIGIYFFRMSAFALVSEIIIRKANQLANYPNLGTNVLVTFALAIVLIAGYQVARYSWLDVIASLRPVSATNDTLPVKAAKRFDVRINLGGIELDPYIGIPLGITMMLLSICAAIRLKPDYGVYGLLTVLFFFVAIHQQEEQDWAKRIWTLQILLNTAYMIYRIYTSPQITAWAIIQMFSLLAIPLCLQHINEKKPSSLAKYAYYFFYPTHILFLGILLKFIR